MQPFVQNIRPSRKTGIEKAPKTLLYAGFFVYSDGVRKADFVVYQRFWAKKKNGYIVSK
jgi:hypothetical protein